MSCKCKVERLIEKTENLIAENETLETSNAELTASNEALQGENASLEARNAELEASIKPEQEKAVTITENGTTEVLPDEGKTLSKVDITVDVPSSESEAEQTLTELETMIDESGLADGETITEKTADLIDKSEQAKLWDKVVLKGITIQNQNSPFIGWTEKTIPKMDFSQLTSLLYTFSGGSIEYIDYYINSENVTNLASCFANCRNLVSLVGVDTSSATSLSEMFLNCTSLETITEPLNISNATNVNKAFTVCGALKDIRFVTETIKVSIAILSAVLTDESIQSIIDGLATVETAQTLTLNSAITLTDEQKATINEKGWTLAQ